MFAPTTTCERIFDQQVVRVAFPERVAGDRHAADADEVDVGLHVGEHVVADRDVAAVERQLLAVAVHEAAAEDADVGRVGSVLGVLDRAAGDGHFGHAAVGAVEQDVGGRRAVLGHVGFDVAAGDVNVADVAAADDDAAAAAIADVAGRDVRLVQIDVVVEDAAAAVLVDVAGVDEHVAIALDEVNAVAALADVDAAERELHRAAGLDAVGLGVLADNREAFDDGHPLAVPDLRLDGVRRGRAAVRADEADRRAGPGHDEPGRAVGDERREADLVEIDDQRLGDAVGAGRKADRAGFGVDQRLNGGRVVGDAVALGAEVEDGNEAGPLLADLLTEAFAAAVALAAAGLSPGNEHQAEAGEEGGTREVRDALHEDLPGWNYTV